KAMCPKIFVKSAPLSSNGYRGAFAFMIKVISNFFDEFAHCPPGFYFPTVDKKFGVMGCVFDKVKPSASRNFKVPQFQLSRARPTRIVSHHSRKAEVASSKTELERPRLAGS